ncbi:hypothetical protein [Rhizobium sp. L245/93]|uniref:hypothetical protein n=1 Tax=Rhizobium sp. L245/93 TaxID=2819998 RepID=UPI001ADC4D87|nr:hypothetical protein [Rhizobium sp. L245/93]MBO9170039.1 hypothetical protein [Rhizobium sp. L245/93]
MVSISQICRELVQRSPPIEPTANEVSERGKIKIGPDFPARQTLYNVNREILRVWKRAFRNICNIDAPDPSVFEDLRKVGTENLDANARALVDMALVRIQEKENQLNMLKAVMAQNPTSSDFISQKFDQTIEQLSEWLTRTVSLQAFELDEFALKVTRVTPPGTPIMRIELFNELRMLVDDHRLSKRGKRGSH